jgi:hypothetical protein
MENTERIEKSFMRRALLMVAMVVTPATLTACSHAMMMVHGTGAKRPAASDFGLGPRLSIGGRYIAMLEPFQPLRPRQMQTVRLRLRDANNRAVDDAQIAIEGGMPQHGHGLPTRPLVTRCLGDGIYDIEGVRFNMGGWWEFKLVIAGARGGDVITFNLDL